MPPRPISYSTTDRMKRDEEKGWRKGEETRYAGEMKEEKEGDTEIGQRLERGEELGEEGSGRESTRIGRN